MPLVVVLQPIQLDVTPQRLQYRHAISLGHVKQVGEIGREAHDVGSLVEVEGEADVGLGGGGKSEGEAGEVRRFC